jgi:menaquinone-dependent protoporphyrinogen IX oxidase
MVSITNRVMLALVILIVVTVAVYSIQLAQAKRIAQEKRGAVYIAKPDWYVTNMEWQPNTVLYDGGNLYYSDISRPKQNSA